MSVVSSALSTRSSSSSSTTSRWKINDRRLASLMDSIYAIAAGLGLRFVVDTVSRHNVKITGTLVGLWEGVILLHFLKKMPKSSDPYVAYGVRLFIDFLVTESVARFVLVVIWTGLGMVLADVTPVVWEDVGLRRRWRHLRRDLYSLSRMIPTVAFFPPTRTVRFSPSREPRVITDVDANGDAHTDTQSVVSPSVVTADPAPPANVAPAPSTRIRRRAPGYFSSGFSDTESMVSMVSSVFRRGERRLPSTLQNDNTRTSRRLSVFPSRDYDITSSITSSPSHEEDVEEENEVDVDNGNISTSTPSSQSTEIADPSSSNLVDISQITEIPDEEETPAAEVAAEQVVAAGTVEKEEPIEGDLTPTQRPPLILPPTPSDFQAPRRNRELLLDDPIDVGLGTSPADAEVGPPPFSAIPSIPDLAEDANAEGWEKIQKEELKEERPPTPPAKDWLPGSSSVDVSQEKPPTVAGPLTAALGDEEWDALASEFNQIPKETTTTATNNEDLLTNTNNDTNANEHRQSQPPPYNDWDNPDDIYGDEVDTNVPLAPPAAAPTAPGNPVIPNFEDFEKQLAEDQAKAERKRLEALAAAEEEVRLRKEQEEREEMEMEMEMRRIQFLEDERRRAEEEEDERRRAEEEEEAERQRLAAEAEAAAELQRKLQEEEAAAKAEEEAKKAEEKAQRKAARMERKKKEDEDAKIREQKRQEEEEERLKKEEEEERKREEEATAARKRDAAEAAERRKQAEEKKRLEEEAEAKRLAEEEEAAKKLKEAEDEKKRQEEEETKRQEQEEENKKKQEETRKKEEEEEQGRKVKQEQEKQEKEEVTIKLEEEERNKQEDEEKRQAEKAKVVAEIAAEVAREDAEEEAAAAVAGHVVDGDTHQTPTQETVELAPQPTSPSPENEEPKPQPDGVHGPEEHETEEHHIPGQDLMETESVLTETSEIPDKVADRLDRLILAKAQMVEIEKQIEDLKAQHEAADDGRKAQIDVDLQAVEKVLRKMKRKEQRRWHNGVRTEVDPFVTDSEDMITVEPLTPGDVKKRTKEKLEELLSPDANSLNLTVVFASKKGGGQKQKQAFMDIIGQFKLLAYVLEDNKKNKVVDVSEEEFAEWLISYRNAATASPDNDW